MSALRDEDPYVRQYVAGTLYKIGDPALVPLILALSDEDP
jgi:HEAT repeat protein